MLRPFLALLWLANYLLVVGAGLVVARPPGLPYSAAHPYRHSADCQLKNYLRLDCFETCNGAPQQAAPTRLPPGAGLHLLAQLKGLDVHCPAPAPRLPRAARPGRPAARALVAAPGPGSAPSAGFGGADYPPPRLG